MADQIRVLIVDDIPETRDHLTKLLGFETDIEVVGAAASGSESLALATNLSPDVVLMDINMPDMDGIAATEKLSAAVPTASVVMMSVQGEADYLRRSMLAGAREFLVKPFSSDELTASIRQVYTREQEKLSRMAAAPSMNGASDDTRTMTSASVASAARAKRASTLSSGPRTTVTPWPRPKATIASSSGLVVVAMATSSISFDFSRRWTMCQRRGLPAIGFSTLPGRRVEPMRAWTMATIRGAGCSGVDGVKQRAPRRRGCAARGACRPRDRRAIRDRRVPTAAGP